MAEEGGGIAGEEQRHEKVENWGDPPKRHKAQRSLISGRVTCFIKLLMTPRSYPNYSRLSHIPQENS